MKPSEAAKIAGLKSLEEMALISTESVQNLINWHRARPVRFELILKGAVIVKNGDKLASIIAAFNKLPEDIKLSKPMDDLAEIIIDIENGNL